jgi:hypothetical protein
MDFKCASHGFDFVIGLQMGLRKSILTFDLGVYIEDTLTCYLARLSLPVGA